MKNIRNEREIVENILGAMNALSLYLHSYNPLVKYVKKGLYNKAIHFARKQHSLKNISDDDYLILMFVLKSADVLWKDHFKTLSR
jgi:hypothetical protein